MPIKDNRSDTRVVTLFNDTVTGNGVFETAALDTLDFDDGITFIPYSTSDGSGTVVNITDIQDSDDNSVFQSVSSDKIIGDLSVLSFTFAITPGTILGTVGVVGTKRFVRVEYTVTSFSAGTRLVIDVNCGVEVAPPSEQTI